MPEKKTLCVTSFHPDHCELCVRRFLERCVEQMDQHMVIHTEGVYRVPEVDHPLVELRDLKSVNRMMETLQLTNYDAAKGKLWGDKPIDHRFNVNSF